MALTDKLTYIADAIRSKTGDTDKISLDEIEATIRGSLAVNPTPSYIVAEAQRVSALVSSSNFNMILGSDAHLYSGNSNHDKSLVSAQYFGMGTKELQKRSNISCVVLNGDYSYMSSTSYNAEQVKRDILLADKALDIGGTQIWCVGNHDWCYGKGVDRMLTSDELYNLIGSKSDGVKPSVDTNRCYGYVDFPTHKIRVIYLNTNDCRDGIAHGGVTKDSYGQLEMISPTQFRWVADVALKFTESGWGVIFVSHHNLDYGYGWFKHFLKMLEAYRDGTNLTLWLTEYVLNGQTTGHNETFNFAGMVNRAEIICNIHGHNHNCAESKVSSSSDVEPWLWRFCVPNICANRYNESATVESRKYMGEFDENGTPVYWYKETGNAKATSFNVVSIDRTNKIINAYIFGAGRDRSMYYGEYIPVEYSITTALTNVVATTSNPTTITEGLSASLAFTASSGYELPDSVTVSGATYNWDKSSGTLTLYNPVGDVSVTVTAVKVSVNLLNMAERTYMPLSTPQFIAATEAHEMDYTKSYAAMVDGRRGSYPTSKLTYTHNAADNGFTYRVSSNSGYGVEFPVQLDGGKEYVLTYKEIGNSGGIQLMKYNTDTTFNSKTEIKAGGASNMTNITSREIKFTPESGYLYSILFNTSVTNTDAVITDISLVEN